MHCIRSETARELYNVYPCSGRAVSDTDCRNRTAENRFCATRNSSQGVIVADNCRNQTVALKTRPGAISIISAPRFLPSDCERLSPRS